MAQLRLVNRRTRMVEVMRDSDPLPGEKPTDRITVDDYQSGKEPYVVAASPYVSTKKWQRFVVGKGTYADRLLAALEDGPVKPNHWGAGEFRVDKDRIKR